MATGSCGGRGLQQWLRRSRIDRDSGHRLKVARSGQAIQGVWPCRRKRILSPVRPWAHSIMGLRVWYDARMTEHQYARVANLVRIRTAIGIVGELIPGYAITEEEKQVLLKQLHEIETGLSATVIVSVLTSKENDDTGST